MSFRTSLLNLFHIILVYVFRKIGIFLLFMSFGNVLKVMTLGGWHYHLSKCLSDQCCFTNIIQ